MKNQTKWSIDQTHSEIAFKIRHLMISNVKGIFKKFKAKIYTLERNFLTAQIDLSIDASSIFTNDNERDAHLKGKDFFDAKNHKQITFISSSIKKTDINNYYNLLGELTIKGITKKIKLNILFGGIQKDSFGIEKASFYITGKINRNDWGLVWNKTVEAEDLIISNEITISCDIELINTEHEELHMEPEYKLYEEFIL